MTAFGGASQAAALFIPPGAKLISSTSRTEPQLNAAGDAVDRSYYTYDFAFGSARVLLTAAVDNGNVILLGSTAASDRWAEAESGFRRAASSFRVGGEQVSRPLFPPSNSDAAGADSSGAAGAGTRTGAGGGGVESTGGGAGTGGVGAEATAAPEVELPRRTSAPAEEMKCKGPLPIFCSVESNQ